MQAMTRKPGRQSAAILALAFLSLATAQARIGETEAQIREHYGDPITALQSQTTSAGVTNCYSAHGFLVAVTFLKGRSVREMITKADSSKITDAEIQEYLNASIAGLAADTKGLTGPKTVTVGVQEWRSLDQHSRVAIYDSHTRALFITTQKFIDLTNANKRAVSMRSDAGGLGAKGRMDFNLKALQKDSAMALRHGQSQPAASPAK